jgi:hypothetical protein
MKGRLEAIQIDIGRAWSIEEPGCDGLDRVVHCGLQSRVRQTAALPTPVTDFG